MKDGKKEERIWKPYDLKTKFKAQLGYLQQLSSQLNRKIQSKYHARKICFCACKGYRAKLLEKTVIKFKFNLKTLVVGHRFDLSGDI